jgi:hypothetical protein
MIKRRQPTVSDIDMDTVDQEGATDDEIAKTLRDPLFWSYIVREPRSRVMCWGRGKTRAECEELGGQERRSVCRAAAKSD